MKIMLWVEGVITTRGTILKGHNVRKLEKHCCRGKEAMEQGGRDDKGDCKPSVLVMEEKEVKRTVNTWLGCLGGQEQSGSQGRHFAVEVQ